MRHLALFLILALGFSIMAEAAQKRVYYSSGTGFFISPYGYIVTNAHVIDECLSGTIELSGAVGGAAAVVAVDKHHDLAVLQSERSPSSYGKLARHDRRAIRSGDEVMVMGYPHDRRREDQYKVEFAQVLDVKGPTGEPQWLQFSNSAQRGNSGGPLLDASGNVIGVVTGKTELFSVDARTRQQTSLGTSDIAITMAILKNFLHSNRIRWHEADSLVERSTDYVEARARRYIANIKCVTGEEIVSR